MNVQCCSSKCVLSRPTNKHLHSRKYSTALVGFEEKERGLFHGSGREIYPPLHAERLRDTNPDLCPGSSGFKFGQQDWIR